MPNIIAALMEHKLFISNNKKRRTRRLIHFQTLIESTEREQQCLIWPKIDGNQSVSEEAKCETRRSIMGEVRDDLEPCEVSNRTDCARSTTENPV